MPYVGDETRIREASAEDTSSKRVVLTEHDAAMAGACEAGLESRNSRKQTYCDQTPRPRCIGTRGPTRFELRYARAVQFTHLVAFDAARRNVSDTSLELEPLESHRVT